MTIPDPTEAHTDRWLQILIGLLLLAAAGFMLFFGGIGLWSYLQGSRTETASPTGWIIGLGTGGWALYLAFRLITGRGRGRHLIPAPLLLTGSLGAIAMGIVGMLLPLFGVELGVRGTAGLVMVFFFGIRGVGLWRSRSRSRSDEHT